MKRSACALLLCALIGILAASPAVAAKRVAFVAGIDRYDNLGSDRQLQKAVNDARAIGAALEKLGFAVTISENAGRIELVRAWSRFLGGVEPGDTAAFFFAGHGIELGGANFLVPRDVPTVGAGEEEVLKEASIRVAMLMEGLKNKSPQVSLVILDACRDNPFVDASGRSLGAGRGLARVEPARGTFVMFSADAGQQALDRLANTDADPNSIYTRSLLPLLATPGLGLRGIAVEVRDRVNRLAKTVGEDQFPAYYDAMQSDLVLAGPKVAAAAPEAPALTSVEPSAPLSEAAQVWPTVEATTSCSVLDSFIASFSASIYADFAKARQQELKCGEQKVAVAAPATTACSGMLAKVGGTERCLAPGDVFRDLAIAPEMVVLPAGTFSMGSPPNEEGRGDDEGPQHDVTIARPFAVSKFEVTFAEWDACAADGGCKSNSHPNDSGWGRGKRPVINVSWDDAKAYVSWLSKKSGKPYRLLSEAEWEYAARAGTTTRYSFGDEFSNSNAQGNNDKGTVAVGQYSANAFGLHDLHGNVWEWVEDCYHDSYSGAPDDGSTWVKACTDDRRRVLRGGSWGSGPGSLRVAYRYGYATVDRYNYLGFRLGRTLTP